jgi:flagellar biosynthesis component FlhA
MLGREPLISLLDRSKKRVLVALALAVLVHLPATPMLPVLRMAHRLAIRQRELDKPTKPQPPPEVEVQLEQALHQEEQHQEHVEEQAARPEPNSPSASLSMAPPVAVPFNPAQPSPKPADDEAIEKAKELKKAKLKDIGLEGASAKKDEVKPGITLGRQSLGQGARQYRGLRSGMAGLYRTGDRSPERLRRGAGRRPELC